MNKLIPFAKFSKRTKKSSFLSNASVVIDRKGVPLGFVFGRDSFISFLERIDSEFEKKVKNPRQAFDNPAGKLIDLIEERLPIKPAFIKDLKSSIAETKKNNWIPFEKVAQLLHV